MANTKRPARPGKCSGFILLYVVGLLAAISIILFKVGRIQSPAPLFMERQLAHELQYREEQNLLDFVIAGTTPQTLPGDPRYQQYQQLVAGMPHVPSEAEEQLALLKALLKQLNFNIDDRRSAHDTAVGSTTDAKTSAAQAGKQGALFTPQKQAYKLQLGDTAYQVLILPGNALPNLNALDFDPLWRYLATLNIAENDARDLAAALIDWRDADDLNTAGRGAESAYYYGMQPPYAARNAPIRTWQELNYVRGMTPEKVSLLRDHFMLGAPEARGVSPDYASPATLTALTGLPPETITTLLQAYGKLDDKGVDLSSVLLNQDTDAFDAVVAWKPDPNLLRIRISAPESTLTADYDAKNKRMIATW